MTYDTDFNEWSRNQADLLRGRSSNGLDWDNLAEEIESLGRNDRREIQSRLNRICEHLLKLAYANKADLARDAKGWGDSIDEARDAIAGLIEESPSFSRLPSEMLPRAFAAGRKRAARWVNDLPAECPWTIEQILDPDFYSV